MSAVWRHLDTGMKEDQLHFSKKNGVTFPVPITAVLFYQAVNRIPWSYEEDCHYLMLSQWREKNSQTPGSTNKPPYVCGQR